MSYFAKLPVAWPARYRYGLAVCLFLVFLLVRSVALPSESGLAFVTFYPAILLAFYVGGAGCGTLTGAMSGLAGEYFFIEPYWGFSSHPSAYTGLLVFGLTSTLVGLIVTKLHRVNERLRESETRWKFAIEGAGNGVWEWNIAKGVSYYSKRWKEILGYADEEIGNSREEWSRRVHPDDLQRVQNDLQTQIEDGHSARPIDYRMQCKDGSWKPIRGRGTVIDRDETGKPMRVIGSIRDMTDIMRARAASDLLNEMAKNIAEGLYLVSKKNLTIIYANPKMEQMFGYGPGEMIGKPVSIINAPGGGDPEEVARQIEAALVEEGTWRGEVLNTRKDGTAFWGYATISAMHHERYGDVYVSLQMDIDEEKRARDALRSSEERMRLFFERQVVGLALTSPDKGWIQVNDKLCEMLGYSHEQLVNKSWAELTHPEDLALDVEQFEQVLSGDIDGYSMDKRFLRSDGAIVYTHLSVGCVRKVDRSVDYILAVLADVTDQKRADEELRDHEARYRALVDTSSDGFWALDRNGRITEVNDRYLVRSGYTREELLQKSLFDIDAIHTDDEIKASLAGPSSHPVFESMHRAKDGSLWPVEVSSVYMPGPRAIRYSFLRDITERRRAEEARAYLAALVESSVDAITGSDLNGTLTSWNSGAQALYGWTADEVLGKKAGILIPPENYDEFEVMHDRVQHGIATLSLETKRVRKDRSLVDVSLTASPVKDSNGQVIGVSVISRDISDRKRLQGAHLQAQKLESLGTLAGGIAHDFNNILAAIRGNADLAVGDAASDSAVAESLAEIQKAAARGTELVRRIIAFGRPTEPYREVTDLAAAVQEVLKLLRSTLSAGIVLQTRFEETAPPVLADSSQVHEVIVNLTTNAAHAIGRRAGLIEYRLAAADLDPRGAAELGLQVGLYACLTVKDNGSGIADATKERIFDAFFTTKPSGEGTGLGLSMVHGVMKSHGGGIAVESTVGEGSSFHLYFPAAGGLKARSAVLAPSSPRKAPPAVRRRVMYVDDEEALVFLAKRALTRLGHSITGYTDATEALKQFREQPDIWDLVVTDLSMPAISGIDLAREILAVRPDIPVVMTTGYIRAEDDARTREVGVRKLIRKPATVDRLAEVLDEVFRGSGSDGAPPRSLPTRQYPTGDENRHERRTD